MENPNTEPDADGRMMIRLFNPCADTFGKGCTVIEDPQNLRLAETRWYPGSLRIFDGSLVSSLLLILLMFFMFYGRWW